MDERAVARFWAKVDKDSADCWIWTGSKRNKGYGAFVWYDGGDVVQGRAHRFSYELHYGKIPDGLCVLHKCDNPSCVNPEHLFIGTKADNNRDMHNKGRAVRGGTYSRKYQRGESHHNSKLTSAIVADLRKDRAGGMSFGRMAKKYSISIGHAYRVATGQAWRSE